MVAHTYNASAREAEVGVLHVWGLSWIHKENIILKGILFLFPIWFHLCNANTQCVSVQTLNSAALNSCQSVKIQSDLGVHIRESSLDLLDIFTLLWVLRYVRFIRQCCIESYNNTCAVCVHVLPCMWYRIQTLQCERLIRTLFKELSGTLESLKRVDAIELCLRQKM